MDPEISVVIPLLNEEENLPELIQSLETYLQTLPVPVEVVFVDDGSTDGSVALLERATFNNFSAKIVKLSRNFGSHPAVRAGFRHASAPNCVWLGADMQEPLEIIGLGYEQIQAGCDLVCIQKKAVHVSRSEELFSHLYSKLIRKYAIRDYPPLGVNTIFFNGKVKKELNAHVESNSSVVLQVLNFGFRRKVLDLEYRERKRGKSKWSFGAKIKLLIDSIVAFSFFPIRLVSTVGFLFALIGGLMALYLIIIKVFNIREVTLGWPSLISLLMVGFGLTNIALGVIAEYLWRTLDASRGRAVFIVDSVVEKTKSEQR